MSEASELIRALSERALAVAKRAPALTQIEPLIGRGWLLSYVLADGKESVQINAEVDPGPPAVMRYSYRQPSSDNPRRLQHLVRVGRMLCLALERERLSPLPAIPTVGKGRHHKEHLGMYLTGMCDRGCVFCSRSLYSQSEVDAVNAEIEREMQKVTGAEQEQEQEQGQASAGAGDAVSVRLPVVPTTPNTERGMTLAEVAAELRPRAATAEKYTVSWSGLDCIASPYFDDALRLAHELGFRDMSIQTPGTRLVEPGFIDFLAAHSVRDVSLTAHARSEALFDRVGGKPGAYRMFWEAVAQLRERDFTLRYEVPCVADTVEDLPAHLAELAEQPGEITVFFWYPEADMGDRFASLGLPMARLLDVLRRARGQLAPKRVAVDGLPLCVVPPELAEHYTWNYRHMSFLECERLEICAECSLREECPGAAPIYLAHHPWPAHAQPVR